MNVVTQKPSLMGAAHRSDYAMMLFCGHESCVCFQVGWPGGALLSDAEQRAHFALWAILKSPLIFGNDLR